jgi:DNA-binding transcriptional ArsR family regulator
VRKNTDRGSSEPDRQGERRSTPGLADDDLYRALAARARRRLLYYLDTEGESTVSDLAAMLVGWDRTERGGMATETEYERTELALRHSHLPALSDAGLVTYDADGGRVTVASLRDDVSELLSRSIEAETE